MATSTKFILRTQSSSKSATQHPIMLQIIIDRKNQLISTRKYSTEEHWNAKDQLVSKDHPDAKSINLLLKTLKAKIAFLFIANGELDDKIITFDDIKKIIIKYTGAQKITGSKKLFEVFEEHIKYLKENNRLGYAGTFKSTLNCLQNFLDKEDRDFLSINTQFLRGYEDWLCLKNCKITTRSVYLRTFRTLWRIAIRDGYCPKEHYPFKDFAFSKYNNPKTKKRAISRQQLDLIETYEIPLEKDTLINSRNYFLFSFYCRGINFTDLANLKWSDIRDGELNYMRSKTKDEFHFKLHPKALSILDYYRSMKGNSDAGFIFPILYKRHDSEQSKFDRKKKVLKRVNEDIKEIAQKVGIEKKITTYVARHSFATALLHSGISKEDIGKTLQHEDLKTTSIYLDEIDNPHFDDKINSIL